MTERDREVLRLAVPALGALLAEPVFLLADSAIVGRLGVLPLAGLGVAGALLATAVSVFVFLAYGTTATVARRLGAGDRRAALSGGVDGMWLALALGVVVALVAWPLSGVLVDVLGASEAARPFARSYLHWSLPGLPGMLVVLAATGVLRGLQDTTTPLVVAVTGAVVNTALNLALVYGACLGIAGSAAGTALTQLGMAVWLATAVVRGVLREGGTPADLAPRGLGVLRSARDGVPLLVRTLALRAALLLATFVAARQGDAGVAAHQVAMVVWTTTALALDALAIAAQALVGRALGAASTEDDVAGVRAVVRRMVVWGVVTGAAWAVVLVPLAGPVAALFSTDAAVRSSLAAALVVLALCLPLAGWVFVLDGVLIGAGDGRYLAGASIASAAVFAPLALAVLAWAPPGRVGLVWLWAAFAGAYTVARLATLVPRERGGAWIVTGAVRRQ